MTTTTLFLLGLLIGAVIAALVWFLLRWWFWRRDEATTIPVAIDALREIDQHAMMRATYFIAAADRPHTGWAVLLRLLRPPMRLLGESGIIHRPGAFSGRFKTAAQIERVFDAIERHEYLTVEIEDLWLPRSWFDTDATPKRGQVYRVPIALFERAYRFRNGELTLESLLAIKEPPPVSLSSAETHAFREWTDVQVTAARAKYETMDAPLRYTKESA